LQPPDFLDWQFLLARRREPEVRALLARARDRVGPDADPDALALAWVREARSAGLALPGRPWSQAFRVLRWGALVFGFLLGGGAAQAVLAVPTGEPANVWVFLGILVLPQLLMVLLVQLGTLWAGARGRESFGALLLTLRGIHRWLVERFGGALRAELPALPSPPGEVWRWLGLTQRLGLAFSLGALTAFLLTMVFVDVGFAWSSTFADLQAHQVERFVRLLSAPWRSWLPQAVPSPEVIATTHWSQLEGRFLGGVEAPGDAARRWWPFLATCLVTYALLPRGLSLLLTDHRARAAVARHRTLDDPAWRELLAELGAVGPWRRPEDGDGGTPEAAEHDGAGTGAPTADAAPRPAPGLAPAAAVAWGGVPLDEAHLRHPVLAAHGLHRAALHRAGGREAHEDESALRAVGPGPEPLWLLVEAGATPDKRLLRFLERLELETGRPLTVGVLRPDGSELGPVPEQELRLWREVTGRLGRRRPAVVLLGPDGEPLDPAAGAGGSGR